MVGLTFFERQWEQHVAGSAATDLKVGNPLVIDFGRKEEFTRIISYQRFITELHDSEAVVEGFKGSFLTFATQHMSLDKYRLPPAFDAKVFEGSLRGHGTGKLAGGTGSNPGHSRTLFQV